MPTVTPDVIFSSKISYSTAAGGTCQRVFRVDGLTPSVNIGFDAIAEVQAKGAQLHQQHPTAAQYFVEGYDVGPCGDSEHPSQSSVWVYVTYSTNRATPNFVVIEMFGSHGTEIMNRWTYGDQKGNPILVGYIDNSLGALGFSAQIGPAERAKKAAAPFFALFDTVAAEVESHNTIVRFTRTEVGSPLANIQAYRQTINSVPWFGYHPGTVLCRDISARNLTSGSVIAPGMYSVVYEFELSANPWGWQRTELFRDHHTNKPLENVTFDGQFNGYTQFYPYPLADFSPLKLPDPRKGTGAVTT